MFMFQMPLVNNMDHKTKLHLLIYFFQENGLRILDIHGTKTHKNQTPLARLPQ